MFGIGMPELVLIFIVALLVIGPQKLPEVLKALGRGLAEFKRATNEIKYTVEMEVDRISEETKDLKQELQKEVQDVSQRMDLMNTPTLPNKPQETNTQKVEDSKFG